MTWKVAQEVACVGLHIHSIADSGFEFKTLTWSRDMRLNYQQPTDPENCWEKSF